MRSRNGIFALGAAAAAFFTFSTPASALIETTGCLDENRSCTLNELVDKHASFKVNGIEFNNWVLFEGPTEGAVVYPMAINGVGFELAFAPPFTVDEKGVTANFILDYSISLERFRALSVGISTGSMHGAGDVANFLLDVVAAPEARIRVDCPYDTVADCSDLSGLVSVGYSPSLEPAEVISNYLTLFITEDTGPISEPLAQIISFGNFFRVAEPGALLLLLSGLLLLALVLSRPRPARHKARAALAAAFVATLGAASESQAALIKGWEYSIIAADARLSLPALDSDQIAYMRSPDGELTTTRIETFDPLTGTQLVAETFSPTPPDRFPLSYKTFFPDTFGNTRFLGRVSLDNGQVAFIANAQNLPPDDTRVIQGVFVGGPGARTVATTSIDASPTPGEGNFQGFPGLRASISSGNVAFNGFGESGPASMGIYADFGGTLQRVADTATAVPPSPGTSGGAGHFTSLSLLPVMVGSNVVFSGRGSAGIPSSGEGFDGIYLATLGGPAPSLLGLVTDDTKIPGTNVNFGGRSFATTPAFGGASVAIFGQASSAEHSGIYLADRFSGLVTRIADTDTLVPGKDTTFSAFRDTEISVDRGNVVFVAETADGPGIYMYLNGSLIEVAEAADLSFPNFETIIALGVQGEALDGRDVAFWAEAVGEGGIQEFIILASIPIPGTVWLVGLALMVMLGVRRKG